MGLPMAVKKVEEAPDHCVYAFGAPDATVGRVRLYKADGDVELLDLAETADGPSEQFYLAHLVPRLHDYHDRDTYPASDQWTA
jgi:hypothetical protein